MQLLTLTLALLFVGQTAAAQTDSVVPGPPDRPVSDTQAQLACFDSLIAPYVAKGKAGYPAAKARFVAGLPPRHLFYVTIRFKDAEGHQEIGFIKVARMAGDTVFGNLASTLTVVRGVPPNALWRVQDQSVLDWLISRPDGTEEGNVVGTFLDTMNGRLPC